MEEAKFNRLARLVNEFVRLSLNLVESATIEAIDHCSEEELIHHTGRRSSDTHFKATLKLKYKDEVISEHLKTGGCFECLEGLTLILNDEKVTDTLWHGIDIWPNIEDT